MDKELFSILIKLTEAYIVHPDTSLQAVRLVPKGETFDVEKLWNEILDALEKHKKEEKI